jgi:hypothetical protein
MNDFERKLSQQTFRAPPPDLRDTLFDRIEIPSNESEPVRWAWRDWFWPSPQAWAALAALWIVFAALSMGDRPASGATTSLRPASPELNGTLLSYHTASNLNHALQLAN